MPTVLIVEDDDAIRNNIIRLLKLEGFEIVSAENGQAGLEQALRHKPDVVISDVSMPLMDGFQLLEAIRADRFLASTSVMLLTALDDRASMRRGMTSGADDYLAKPFTRVELLDALQGLLKKKERIDETVESAVKAREDHLRRAFTQSLGGATVADKFGLEAPLGAVPDTVMAATVLFSDIRNFTSLAERLDSAEVAELLTQYFERVCEPVLKNGGRHLKFIGDGLMAVFADTLSGGSPLPAARRSVSAALGMALATHEFRAWLHERFGHRGLPPFAIGVGMHSGEVTICRLGTIHNKETTPIGDTVNVAARLESSSKELGWTVVASSAVLEGAGDGIQTGGMTSLNARGKDGFVDVAEIIGLVTNIEDMRHGMATLTERAQDVRDAVRVNSEITARAVKGALQSKLSAFKDHQFSQGDEPLRLKGYRLTRKIGTGGMTEVFLAVRESDSLPVVLKVLDASGKAVSEHLSRFIQEYTLLSRIDHPHVIRIYDQGFTDDHAYIAMEYFETGDLRAEITKGMSGPRVIEIITQVAQALEAIHQMGVIHRDLKPENIMQRADGSVALADFGIAKSMLQQENMAFTQTRHGDVVGTPYYLSPEQAAGGAITPVSDLYSLGVMMFEMLAGARPYKAETLESLLAQHISAPTPLLPAPHEALQPIVERLMCKKPAERYPSAQALLDDLQAISR
ncbi:protein kinase [Caenimonas koreensis DSM 17982]|uniref:Protein kinase n=1 Tax=Caenimonas koreensis DSM 17982 TaxID=1121255 RepID=A0A844B7I6_9BURK|nr:protein kinase [Caenimonas koreensis]MRD47609.1 protein kinase [Caenimonas koreensis DSM 17982]